MTLWRLLSSLGGDGSESLARSFTLSLAVVPPPVPAAVPAFERHVCLLATLKPLFCTLTSRTPYFSNSAGVEGALSATQQAVGFVRRVASCPTVLTLAATMPTGWDPTQHASTQLAHAATRDGVRGVLHDFLRVRGGEGVLVLRGEDGGATLCRGLPSEWPQVSSPSQSASLSNGATVSEVASTQMGATQIAEVAKRLAVDFWPYADFHDGVDLLRFVSTAVSPGEATLCVAGYPQGHPMDRCWGTNGDPSSCVSRLHLAALDAVPSEVRRCNQSAEWDALDRIGHVIQMWNVPSSLPKESAQRAMHALVYDKILSCGAQVVITQMLSNAEEFIKYAQAVEKAVCAAGRGSNSETDGASSRVMVVPGVMAPLSAEAYARVVRFTKVVPSVVMQDALRDYYNGLRVALTQEESVSVAEIKAELENTFLEIALRETESLCRSLMAAGYRHFNFAAFDYKCSPALVQLVKRLEEAKPKCQAGGEGGEMREAN